MPACHVGPSNPINGPPITPAPADALRLFDLVKPRNEDVRLAYYWALRNCLVAKDLDQASRIAYGSDRRFGRVITLDVSGPVLLLLCLINTNRACRHSWQNHADWVQLTVKLPECGCSSAVPDLLPRAGPCGHSQACCLASLHVTLVRSAHARRAT
jgi:hypothetical protein